LRWDGNGAATAIVKVDLTVLTLNFIPDWPGLTDPLDINRFTRNSELARTLHYSFL
jgi:hypothetical protein